MADMREIGTLHPQGTIKVIGKVHGALNTVVTPADGSHWYFKQFTSPEEFYQFIQTYNLVMQGELPNENDHSA